MGINQLETAPRPTMPPKKTESAPLPFNYAKNTENVKSKLQQFGFGEPITFLTEHGLNKKQYISYAQKRLLGKEYAGHVEEKGLPEYIGEVKIPENVRIHGPEIAALLLSFNVGYGHLRTAKALQQTIDVLGGETHDLFFGGDTNVFHKLNLSQHFKESSALPTNVEKGTALLMALLRGDPDKFVRSVSKIYTEYSLRDAYEKGMMHEEPKFEKRTLYDKRVARMIGLPVALGEKFFTKESRKKWKQLMQDPDALVADFFMVKDTQTTDTIEKGKMALRTVFLKNFVELIKQVEDKTTKKELLIIATHFAVAYVVGDLPKKTMDTLPLPYQTAHFQPDALLLHAGYTDNPPTYVERQETADKWGLQEGKDGPNDAIVLNGYVAPLSVYERQKLSQERSDAIKRGEPLTVVAPASGVNPAQLGVFKEFMKDHKNEINTGSMHMVVQCGHEKSGGIITYDELKKFTTEQGLNEKNIVLHVGKTPEAAMDFLEAVSWTPKPVALLVKGAEVARMAQALNIPHIATGALGAGGHEIWNIAMSVLDNPDSVVFPKKIGEVFQKTVAGILPSDVFVRRHQNKEFVADLLQQIQNRTPHTPEQLTQQVRTYIASGHQPSSRQDAMLSMLSMMIAKNHPEETLPS